MKKDTKIFLVGSADVKKDIAKALAGSDITIIDGEPVFYITNHYSDDTGFFSRMQNYLPTKETKKGKNNRPFYWGARSKKELRKCGIK